jgi:hypothetical protein
MDEDCEPESIEDVLDCVEDAAEADERVAVSDIVDRIGDDAFAPLMLLPALVMVSPATAIFGVATFCGLIIVLIAFQMAVGREKLWLPHFILNRTVSSKRLDTATGWLAKPARVVDGLTRKRLAVLVEPPVDRLWAGLCMMLALAVPMFELVPMSASIIAGAIALFGLAMLAKDGLLAILGVAVLGGAVWLLWSVAA